MTTDHQGAEALDNCKHCGSGELFLDVYGHHVACERCGISTRDYDSDAEAIAAWNRRPAPASDLRAAAQAVVDRWDSPQWKDEPHTAEFINRLRRALEAVGGDDALAARAPQWLPIEQAPKDGTELLGWREDCGVMIIRWTAPTHFMTTNECERALADDPRAEEWLEAEDWFCADFNVGCRLDGSEAPTKFMPLPAAPGGGEDRE